MVSRIFLIVTLALLTTNLSQAQTGSAEDGKAKAGACIACHGVDGNSTQANFPNLAGQVPGYIAKQLAKFKNDQRDDPTMKSMATQLSAQDMQDLDTFYASLPAKTGSITQDQAGAAKAGGKVFRGGFKRYKISACMSCHGPAGHGIPPNFPRLSGQNADYVEKQLLAFKDGSRKDNIMNPIAFALSAQQIKQLALYISALN